MKRTEIEEIYKWKTSDIFPTPSAWQEELEKLTLLAPTFTKWKGRLGESPKILKQILDEYFDLCRRVSALRVDAYLQLNTDMTVTASVERMDKSTRLGTLVAETLSFFDPELMSLPESTAQLYLNAPELSQYRRVLEERFRFRPHTLSAAEETILASTLELLGGPKNIFKQLTDTDFNFGSITVDGRESKLTSALFASLLEHPDRSLRAKAFHQYMGEFIAHENTLAATFSASVKQDIFQAKVRKFTDCRAVELFDTDIPPTVYENVIQFAVKGAGLLQRYYKLKQKVLGLDNLHGYDLFTPLTSEASLSHTWSEACSVMIDSLEPMGEEYTEILHKGVIEDRWVDVYENEGKNSGAFCYTSYNYHPFILMNYRDDSLRSLFTLTHEAGHAMHTYYSYKSQPYHYSSYTIFVAEVASNFHERLLESHLKEKYAGNSNIMAYLLAQELDEFRSSFFRQAAFAAYEQRIHELAEKGGAITKDSIRSIWSEILDQTEGDTVERTAEYLMTPLRIPHFYGAFYVYKYTTGIIASFFLASQVKAGAKGARERYLEFIKSGCSDRSLNILKRAGVDLTSNEPFEEALTIFSRSLTELEKLLAR